MARGATGWAGGAVRRATLLTAALLAAAAPPAAAQSDPTGPPGAGGDAACPQERVFEVPGAERQEIACLADLTTAGTTRSGHTNQSDWDGLHSEDTKNPSGVPGIQVDGYFPDTSSSNMNNNFNHDAQFVLRFPDEWNGKLVITGAPGIRRQYANDFIIGDYVLAKGYAFASTDKGNTGLNFFQDGVEPGDAVAEWHRRVTELTVAAQEAMRRRYGRSAAKTYITGISNGGYLTRYALENHPELYDGGVDWEGTLFRAEGPNLFTYLPTSLREYPDFRATGSEQARQRMYEAGFEPGSELLWDNHYAIYWDLTQRVYREEFDPGYDGPQQAGTPFCQQGSPQCDANYDYASRPQAVKDAVGRVSNTGNIGKPMLTLHGTLDALLPIRTDSDVYAKLVDEAGRGALHRYYKIEAGNHVDGLYDDHKDELRPILPCHRTAFEALERWVEGGAEPPGDQTVARTAGGDIANVCPLEPARQGAAPSSAGPGPSPTSPGPSSSAVPGPSSAPAPTAKRRFRVSLSRRRLPGGRRSRLAVRVTDRATRRPVSGAQVRIAGRSVRTKRSGRLVIRRRFNKAGVRRLDVTRAGYARSSVRVRILRR